MHACMKIQGHRLASAIQNGCTSPLCLRAQQVMIGNMVGSMMGLNLFKARTEECDLLQSYTPI